MTGAHDTPCAGQSSASSVSPCTRGCTRRGAAVNQRDRASSSSSALASGPVGPAAERSAQTLLSSPRRTPIHDSWAGSYRRKSAPPRAVATADPFVPLHSQQRRMTPPGKTGALREIRSGSICRLRSQCKACVRGFATWLSKRRTRLPHTRPAEMPERSLRSLSDRRLAHHAHLASGSEAARPKRSAISTSPICRVRLPRPLRVHEPPRGRVPVFDQRGGDGAAGWAGIAVDVGGEIGREVVEDPSGKCLLTTTQTATIRVGHP